MSTFIPFDVSTCAAMPPAAPDPITTASYVVARSTSAGRGGGVTTSVIAPAAA